MYKSANDLYLGIKTTEHIYTNIYIYIQHWIWFHLCPHFFSTVPVFYRSAAPSVVCGISGEVTCKFVASHAEWCCYKRRKLTPHPGGFGENTWTNRTISKEGLEFFGGDKGCLITRFLSTHPLPPKKKHGRQYSHELGWFEKKYLFQNIMVISVGSGPWWISRVYLYPQKPDPKTMETSDLANDTVFGVSKQVVPKNVTSQSNEQGRML